MTEVARPRTMQNRRIITIKSLAVRDECEQQRVRQFETSLIAEQIRQLQHKSSLLERASYKEDDECGRSETNKTSQPTRRSLILRSSLNVSGEKTKSEALKFSRVFYNEADLQRVMRSILPK